MDPRPPPWFFLLIGLFVKFLPRRHFFLLRVWRGCRNFILPCIRILKTPRLNAAGRLKVFHNSGQFFPGKKPTGFFFCFFRWLALDPKRSNLKSDAKPRVVRAGSVLADRLFVYSSCAGLGDGGSFGFACWKRCGVVARKKVPERFILTVPSFFARWQAVIEGWCGPRPRKNVVFFPAKLVC